MTLNFAPTAIINMPWLRRRKIDLCVGLTCGLRVSCLIAVVGVRLPEAHARIVVGLSTEQTIRFLRAYQRGVRHTRENREDGIRTLRKYVGLDAAEAAAGYDESRESFPLDGRILDAGIIATIEQETETGRLKGKVSAGEMIDQGFINLMAKSGR